MKTPNKILLAFIISSLAPLLYSQNYQWAKDMGGVGKEEGSSIALDAARNVYTTGSFMNTADFDPGTSTANLTSVGGKDI